ncbi:AMP-binding protein [Mycolicibacterium sp. 050232]|uniref:AMP-binding protein n=1 Tax=Mycolicibacterium sp. 050232 TaxID=3113982 RepID=UPI003FA538C3
MLEAGQRLRRVPLSRSQQNIYNGVLQDADPDLYLIGRRYRLQPIERSVFWAALRHTILSNPVQLCTLEATAHDAGYPELVARLDITDVVDVQPDGMASADHGARSLCDMWAAGILGSPLVRYTIRTDLDDRVCGFDVHCHHVLLDGGATGIIERELGVHLASAASRSAASAPVGIGLAELAAAHRREESRIADSSHRLAESARRELTENAHQFGSGPSVGASTGAAAKGVLGESVVISGEAYREIVALSEGRQVPLNVLVAAAALAVDASARKSTEGLLVHAVDNRFGDSALEVATCLVNSVAQPVRFAPFASVEDVVRALDRGYVKAMRRRWLREEHYRRMYLAINRTTHVDALTLNFLREPCAPELRRFLCEPPVTTHIGPVESTTVAGILDEEQQTLQIMIWQPADRSESQGGIAERIARALRAFTTMWRQPIAMAVDEWFGVTESGACELERRIACPQPSPTAAWFVDSLGDVVPVRERRRYVDAWIAWLVRTGVEVGQVVVCTDDNTDKTIDLLLACHLTGGTYSVCDMPEQLGSRADRITENTGAAALVVHTAAVHLEMDIDGELRARMDRRVEQVARDPELPGRAAYLMPTSGSTGEPKLVEVTHGALAGFCHAVRRVYGWGPQDTILQCAPLTSDISVEEIFAGFLSGATVVRSSAMKAGDLQGLTNDLVSKRPTLLDLPTAVWHLLCEDSEALEVIGGSGLRQIVIGGEAIRTGTVDKWANSLASKQITLLSSYGPTETTVVVTYLPTAGNGVAVERAVRPRLGRPLVAGSVFVAFGEVVIVGEGVSPGYLGVDSPSFGTVVTADDVECPAFATADRVTIGTDGFPVFSGRKDLQVKVAGKRVDVAEVTRRIVDEPEICDVAVELHDGALGVWFESRHTRNGAEDPAVTAWIRSILVDFGVGSFFVVGVPRLPRKGNGKVDGDNLPEPPRSRAVASNDPTPHESAVGVAEIWSRKLRRRIGTDSSLLDEGIGSLDLISILPETRRYLGWQLSIFDLISADTAADLVRASPTDPARAEIVVNDEVDRDLKLLCRPPSVPGAAHGPRLPGRGDGGAIVVLGASGIVGTGFAQAVLELRKSGIHCPEVVLAMRSSVPAGHPWDALRATPGVEIERLSPELGPAELDSLLRGAGAATVVNCIGNANMLVPYRELRPANVEFVSAIAGACSRTGARLVHLSTSVVGADVTAPRVTDPRQAPYPYAASKALAELGVTCSPDMLDFTMVRLPRILGDVAQLRESTDILVSLVDACRAVRARPQLGVTEEVTTGICAAGAILGRLPGVGAATDLGRGIVVLRGEALAYADFLADFVDEEIDAAQWKARLDESGWARENPRRWAIIDAWLTLGAKLDGRTYAQYLDTLPTIDLRIGSVETIVATPDSLFKLIEQASSRPV